MKLLGVKGLPSGIQFCKDARIELNQFSAIVVMGDGELTPDNLLTAVRRVLLLLDKIAITRGQIPTYKISTATVSPDPKVPTTHAITYASNFWMIGEEEIDLSQEIKIGQQLGGTPQSIENESIIRYFANSMRTTEPGTKLAELYKIVEIIDKSKSGHTDIRAFRNWTQHHDDLERSKVQKNEIELALGGKYSKYDSNNPPLKH